MAINATLNAAPSSSSTPTVEELQAALAAARAENEKLRAKGVGKVTLKVSEKGALSVYGMGRWPVTLYASQWENLLGHADAIKAFLRENASKLARKE